MLFFTELKAIIEEKNKELEQKAEELKERSPEAQRRERNPNVSTKWKCSLWSTVGMKIQSVYLPVLRIIAVQVEIEKLVNVPANNTNSEKIKGKKKNLQKFIWNIYIKKLKPYFFCLQISKKSSILWLMGLKIKPTKTQNWVSIAENYYNLSIFAFLDPIFFFLLVFQILSQQDEISLLKKEKGKQLEEKAKLIKGGMQ